MPADPATVTRWALVAGWAACIFVASTGWFSGDHTGFVLMPLLVRLFPGADPATLHAAHAVLRKLGHFAEYCVLGLLLVRALRGRAAWSPAAAVRAVAVATLYAASDELHQHFVPGRTGAVGDVLIDAAGAVAGQVLLAVRRISYR